MWARKKDAVSNKLSVLRYFNDGEWEIIADTYKVVNETIVQLLKLKYDDFTRTVVLPQGKFDEFLNGNNAKRRELLKKLAGLEILDKMKSIADEKEAEIGKILAEIQGSLSVIIVAEPETVGNWKQELKHYRAELPKLKEAQKLASNRLTLLNNLLEKQNKLDIAQKNLNELNEQSEIISQARANLIQIDAASEIHPLKVELDGYRNQLLGAKNSIEELEQTLQLAEHKTQDTEIKLRELESEKPDVKRLELLEDKLSEITTLSSVTNSLVLGEGGYEIIDSHCGMAVSLFKQGKLSSMTAVLYTFVLQKGGANVILQDNPAIIQGAGIEALFLNPLSRARGTVT